MKIFSLITSKIKPIAIISFILMVGITIVSIQMTRIAKRNEEIAKANAAALIDEVHQFQYKVDTTLHAFAIKQEQGTVKANKDLQNVLNKLNVVSKSIGDIKVSIKSDTGHTTHDVPVVNGVRTAIDSLQGPPIVGVITTTAPVDTTKPITIDHQLSVIPFTLTYSLSCTKQKPRTPEVTLQAPTWVTAEPQRGIVDPTVCVGEKPSLFGGIKLGSKESFIAGAGAVTGIYFLVKGIKSLLTH